VRHDARRTRERVQVCGLESGWEPPRELLEGQERMGLGRWVTEFMPHTSHFTLHIVDCLHVDHDVLTPVPVQPDSDFECIAVMMEHSQDVKTLSWHPKEEVGRAFSSPTCRRHTARIDSLGGFAYPVLRSSHQHRTTPTYISSGTTRTATGVPSRSSTPNSPLRRSRSPRRLLR
jgi:hypothetical protein